MEKKKKMTNEMKAKGKAKGKRCKCALSTTPRSRRTICLDPVSSDSGVEGNICEFDAVQGGLKAESDEEVDDGTVHSPIVEYSSRHRPVQIPARFWDESDGDEGVICVVDPEGLASEVVFWVDCDVCGSWVHIVCAFKKNIVT